MRDHTRSSNGRRGASGEALAENGREREMAAAGSHSSENSSKKKIAIGQCNPDVTLPDFISFVSASKPQTSPRSKKSTPSFQRGNMYRKKPKKADRFTFPDTLEGLGYMINDEGQLRSIEDGKFTVPKA
ncbi:hypothetical protein BC937DRAFT_94462 [Endogone sp. FLAS-F59071]|nr:hypothetical protein BC937DRAFT_94462 [Endogone sp. FLAS-F59071]|eukprot:RUS14020.1 hypothetical protein BC937DRAFT_94462 [Endogone sp. FLAS-F59071]